MTSRTPAETRCRLLQDTVTAAAQPDQPETLYQVLEQALAGVCGHKLFTLMILHQQTGEAERVYSSQPEAYPVAGRKQMVDTPWFRQVIGTRSHYLGLTENDIRWAFPDHELIISLGCGSILNLLVVYNGTVLGSANLLHEEHYYRHQDILDALPFVQLLALPFQLASEMS